MELLSITLFSRFLAGNRVDRFLPKLLITKLLRIMKLTAIFLFACLIQVSANTNAQNVTLSVKDVSLEDVLKLIEKQSGFTYVVKKEVLYKAKNVTVNLKEVSIKEALDASFKNQPFAYSIDGKIISIITPAPGLFSDDLSRQNNPPPITGIVRGPDGHPLAGANIIIKGTGKGTTSGNDGKFSIDAKPGDVLLVSSIGFATKELSISNNDTILIDLQISNSKLDEVQIIGYGITTQRLNTGNVSSVKAVVIKSQPVTNPLLALQGRVAGLQVIQSSSTPGAPVTVRIRGQNSIGANNNPLYVIDGVPFSSSPIERFSTVPTPPELGTGNPLNSISSNDIESIEILKDADATAVYGSRGANGVILISTRKGKAGKTKTDVDLNNGFGKIVNAPKFLNLQEYLNVRKEAFNNSGVTPTIDNAPELLLWDQTSGTDWQAYYLSKTTHRTNGSLSLSGGNSQLSYLISGGILSETSPQKTSSRYKRSNVHLNLNYESVNHRFRLISNSFFTGDNNKQFGTGALNYSQLSFSPNYPAYKADGSYNYDASGNNPLSGLGSYSKSHTYNLNSSVNLSYSPVKNLYLRANLGYNKLDNDQLSAAPYRTLNPIYFTSGYSNFGNQTTTALIAEPQVNYTIQLKRSNLSLLAGSTIQSNVTVGKQLNISGYTNDELIESLNYGNVTYKGGNTKEYKYLSFFGRITYNWNNKYILNTTLRRDGSTRFGPNKQFGSFGSIGAAWIFSEEQVVKDNFKVLSFGKLRGSWGTTGNDGIGDYGFLSLYNNATNYGTATTLIPTAIANPNFGWEVNKKLELGIDLGFLRDRILLNIAWYRNRSGNQLVNYPLPSTTGFTSYLANLPALVENRGVELELSSNNVKNKSFSWTSALNISLPKNKLISFPGIESTSYADSYVVGQSLGIIQRYHFTGLDPQTGEPSVEDINKNGNITPTSSYNNQGGDFVIAGKTNPAAMIGFNNSFAFKGFNLDIFLQYVQQDGINLLQYYYMIGSKSNVWTDFLNYWKQPGDLTNLPRPTYAPNLKSYNYTRSDITVSDASFLRIKNVVLSYSLSPQVLERLHLANLRFYIQANNLFTITKFMGYDPETQSSNYSAGGYTQIPPIRMVVFGLNLTL